MGFTKIWERYFLKEVLKTFFLFLVCFYGLYTLIDYANHGRTFQQAKGLEYFYAFCLYYACEFVNRGEVLVPFAILLGTIKTLCKLNHQNELVAMLTNGITTTRLLRPFLLLGLFFTGLMYFNTQFLVPVAASYQKSFDDAHMRSKNQKHSMIMAEHMILEDGSTLLYQNYDSVKDLLFDVYWVRSIDDVYKINYLQPHISPPIGYFVDHLIRNKKDELVVEQFEEKAALPGLKFDSKRLTDSFTPPENLSLSKLWAQLPDDFEAHSEKEARVLSAFHRKLVLPWLCLLAVVASAPFCIRFSRQFPTFLVYAGALFGLISLYIILDAVHVLGRRQVLDPLYALWTPIVLFSLIFGWRYVRL